MLKNSTSLNFLIIILLSLINFSSTKEAYITENTLIKLNEENLGIATHEFKYLPILFYSPSDPNCKNAIAEFEKASMKLRKENFVFGKIDSDVSSEIIRYFRVEAIPSIALFYLGKPEFYEGEKKEKEIIDWVLEKTKRDYNEIHSERDLEEFKKLYDISMVYCGKDSKIMREIILAERKMDNIPMGTIPEEEMIKSHAEKGHKDAKDFIILFTATEEKIYYLYNITSENIIDFYNLYSTPKVIEFSAQTSPILFSKRLNSLMIFSTRTQTQFEEMKTLLGKLWPKLNRKLKLFVSDINEGMSVRLSEYCGAKEKDLPIAYILEPIGQNPIKYRLQEKITEESLLKFASQWEKKEIKPFMKTEPEFVSNDGDVFNLVGTNYKKYVIENDKDVVVYFYAPWCEHCKNFYPRFERLARKLNKRNKNLLFAKMDATENDIEYFAVNKYPTIKFYPGNAKDKEPIHLSNKLGIVDMLDVIKSKAYHKINDENYDRNKEIELEKIDKENEQLNSDL